MKKELIDYLIGLIDKHDLSEIEYSHFFSKIKISKKNDLAEGLVSINKHDYNGSDNDENLKRNTKTENSKEELNDSEAAIVENDEDKYHVVRSPIVGTFYRAPSPEADPFVDVGTKVKKQDSLCIIEAMKMMNEIDCDVDGTVVEILVENGTAVTEEQPLFYIK